MYVCMYTIDVRGPNSVRCDVCCSVTNIFLVNLSAADLLVTSICMPIQLSKAITLVWFYGDTVCKIVNYIQGVAVAASVFTLTAMSVDRWLSIAPEPRLRPPSRRQAMLLLGLLWVAAMLVFIPLLVVATVRREAVPIISKAANNISVCSITILSYACMGRTLCSVRPPFDIDEGNVSMQQGIRLMKERKRVAWILLLLAVLFALCWLPYNIMQLLLDMNAVDPKHLSMYLPYALFIGHANSAINPIVYCLMTRNFQRSVRKLVCGRAACKQSKFTWRCNQKPERSSSDYELYHEPHKRCYIHMKTLRHNGETHGGLVVRDPRQTTQLSHVTRSSRRTAPAHLLSAEMLQRHGHIDLKR
ncbi:Neuropeptide FF receptor 2 [Papilio xuthus]|uniref:Neuropeptide FF receptor 2 n=1 Tax=Papilio xuthus TaxID=66420 RepID=A0A194Q809_PAPXU|nr:Neuropeptide FF receptor 2 [Papilio xuthus]